MASKKTATPGTTIDLDPDAADPADYTVTANSEVMRAREAAAVRIDISPIHPALTIVQGDIVDEKEKVVQGANVAAEPRETEEVNRDGVAVTVHRY